jgi:hypothetical protein
MICHHSSFQAPKGSDLVSFPTVVLIHPSCHFFWVATCPVTWRTAYNIHGLFHSLFHRSFLYSWSKLSINCIRLMLLGSHIMYYMQDAQQFPQTQIVLEDIRCWTVSSASAHTSQRIWQLSNNGNRGMTRSYEGLLNISYDIRNLVSSKGIRLKPSFVNVHQVVRFWKREHTRRHTYIHMHTEHNNLVSINTFHLLHENKLMNEKVFCSYTHYIQRP